MVLFGFILLLVVTAAAETPVVDRFRTSPVPPAIACSVTFQESDMPTWPSGGRTHSSTTTPNTSVRRMFLGDNLLGRAGNDSLASLPPLATSVRCWIVLRDVVDETHRCASTRNTDDGGRREAAGRSGGSYGLFGAARKLISFLTETHREDPPHHPPPEKGGADPEEHSLRRGNEVSNNAGVKTPTASRSNEGRRHAEGVLAWECLPVDHDSASRPLHPPEGTGRFHPKDAVYHYQPVCVDTRGDELGARALQLPSPTDALRYVLRGGSSASQTTRDAPRDSLLFALDAMTDSSRCADERRLAAADAVARGLGTDDEPWLDTAPAFAVAPLLLTGTTGHVQCRVAADLQISGECPSPDGRAAHESPPGAYFAAPVTAAEAAHPLNMAAFAILLGFLIVFVLWSLGDICGLSSRKQRTAVRVEKRFQALEQEIRVRARQRRGDAPDNHPGRESSESFQPAAPPCLAADGTEYTPDELMLLMSLDEAGNNRARRAQQLLVSTGRGAHRDASTGSVTSAVYSGTTFAPPAGLRRRVRFNDAAPPSPAVGPTTADDPSLPPPSERFYTSETAPRGRYVTTVSVDEIVEDF